LLRSIVFLKVRRLLRSIVFLVYSEKQKRESERAARRKSEERKKVQE